MEIDTTEWDHSGEGCFDLVAVRGFYTSSNKEPWGGTADGANWLTEKLKKLELKGRVLQYNYEGDASVDNLQSEEAIQEQARRLLEQLAEARRDQSPPLPIVFISVDFGAVIVKTALVLASGYGADFANIKASTRLLTFIGAPHRWRDTDDLSGKIAAFVFSKSPAQANYTYARTFADSIISVSNSFLQTGVLARATIVNVFPTEADAIEVQHESTATLDIPFEKRCAIEKDAVDLSVDENRESIFEAIKARIVRVTEFPWADQPVTRQGDIFEAQAAPVYPLKTYLEDKHPFSWLSTNKPFQDWVDATGGCHLLHIHGDPSVSLAAEYAFKKMTSTQTTPDSEIVSYFSFNGHDVRRNSIRSMAATFLSQTLGRSRLSVTTKDNRQDPPQFEHWFTDADAFLQLKNSRFIAYSQARITWILDGLDQLDSASSRWLLTQLQNIFDQSEWYFKVLVTTVEDKSIRSILAKHPEVELKGQRPVAASLSDGSTPSVERVQDSRIKSLRSPTARQEIKALLESCGTDTDLANMTLDWLLLKEVSIRSVMGDELAALSPLTPSSLLKRILEAVPGSSRPWAQRVILWIWKAARPLSPQELDSLLSFDGDLAEHIDVSNAGIVVSLRNVFGPLFTMENNEIRFRHPSAWDVFSSADATAWYSTSPEAAHTEISRLCVRFLSRPATQAHIDIACRSPRDSVVLVDHKSNLQSYAVRYWHYHYMLGRGTAAGTTADKEVLEYLSNPAALRLWFAAHWHVAEPARRADRSYSHPLPILAYIGLVEEVGASLASLESSVESTKLITFALIEAARMGHKDLARKLLQFGVITVDNVLAATEAAAGSGEIDVLEHLVSHIISSNVAGSYSWPNEVLCRVAWKGPTRLLKDLLTTQTPDLDPEFPTPLYCAALGDHLDNAALLIKHGADLELHDEQRLNRTALNVAARYGFTPMVKLLIEAGADIEATDVLGRGSLHLAGIRGQHQAFRALLDAGADVKTAERPTVSGGGYPLLVSMAFANLEICVRLLLEHGVNVNSPGDNGTTALTWAADKGRIGMCRLLLDNGAEVNGTEKDHPLAKAIESENLELLELFLDRGADVNATLGDDGPPLDVAVTKKFKEAVTLLLEKGAQVNPTYTRTPLFQASLFGYTEIMSLLLAAGADPELENKESTWKPLHAAYDSEECVKILLDGGAQVDAPSKDNTALYLTAYHGYPASAVLLLERGAKTEIRCNFPDLDDDQYTPLLAATSGGYPRTVRAILEAGADINAKAPNGRAAIHVAVSKSSVLVLKTLLEFNPDLGIRDNNGYTALHCIGQQTKVGVINALINRGADLEIREEINNCTPLSIAIRWGNMDVVKALIKAKAKINITGDFWGGPLHVAAHYHNLEAMKLLVANGGDVDLLDPMAGTPLHVAFNFEHKVDAVKDELGQYLIKEAGANPNIHGGYLWSALHAACIGGSLDIVKTLIAGGADVHDTDSFGHRPIHLASFRTVDYINHLISAGADPTVRDKSGRTLLHTAVASGRVDVVQRVLSLTSDLINEPDRDGWTPLLWAARQCLQWETLTSNQAAVIKLLLEEGADLWVQGRGSELEWSALKLARYYGASKEVISLLTPRDKVRVDANGQKRTWNPQAHRSRKGKFRNGYCDACLYSGYGMVYFSRKYTMETWICFKCYELRAELFPDHHAWELKEDEFDPDSTEEASGEEEETSQPVGSPSLVKQVQTIEADYWTDSD